MSNKAITVVQSKRIDDSYAIDATGDLASDALKGIVFAWHSAATGVITNPLQANQVLSVTALRSSLVERSPGVYNAHLIVSEQIFGRMRDALNANLRLRLTITHQVSAFMLQCLAAPAVVEPEPDSYLRTISETLQATGENVLQLQQDVATIKQLLANGLAAQAAGVLDNGKSKRHEEYRSEGGVGQS